MIIFRLFCLIKWHPFKKQTKKANPNIYWDTNEYICKICSKKLVEYTSTPYD